MFMISNYLNGLSLRHYCNSLSTMKTGFEFRYKFHKFITINPVAWIKIMRIIYPFPVECQLFVRSRCVAAFVFGLMNTLRAHNHPSFSRQLYPHCFPVVVVVVGRRHTMSPFPFAWVWMGYPPIRNHPKTVRTVLNIISQLFTGKSAIKMFTKAFGKIHPDTCTDPDSHSFVHRIPCTHTHTHNLCAISLNECAAWCGQMRMRVMCGNGEGGSKGSSAEWNNVFIWFRWLLMDFEIIHRDCG